MDSRTDRPHVQVDDLLFFVLQGLTELAEALFVGLVIEKDVACFSEKSDRPVCHENRADDAHDGVHPDPAEKLGGEQREDGGDGRKRVGHYVQVGGTEVLVFAVSVAMPMVVVVSMMMVVSMMVTEDEHASAVYDQSDYGDGDCPIELDGDGVE